MHYLRLGKGPLESGLTSDPLSGFKSGSRGSAAGQRTRAYTRPSHEIRRQMMCWDDFYGKWYYKDFTARVGHCKAQLTKAVILIRRCYGVHYLE